VVAEGAAEAHAGAPAGAVKGAKGSRTRVGADSDAAREAGMASREVRNGAWRRGALDKETRRGVHNPYGWAKKALNVCASASFPRKKVAVEVSETSRTAGCISSPTAVLRVSRTSPGAFDVVSRSVSFVSE
jgi:hypothetical protein